MALADTLFASCHFLPWVGPAYDARVLGELRTLVLGESHYDWGLDPSCEREATRIVMSEEIAGRFRHPFFARLARALLGPGTDVRAQATALWNGVAFYNYVQEYVGTRPKDRPTPEAWRSAAAAFQDVLRALRPQLVLACGRELYDHVKAIPGLTDEPKFGADRKTRSREIAIGDGERAVLGCMYHPASFGFSPSKWHGRIAEYIVRAHDLREGIVA